MLCATFKWLSEELPHHQASQVESDRLVIYQNDSFGLKISGLFQFNLVSGTCRHLENFEQPASKQFCLGR